MARTWAQAISLGALSAALCGPGATMAEATSPAELKTDVVASGLNHPWGLAFLPDGRMLVTERVGTMRIVSGGKLSAPLAGLPPVQASGQGGLLDVSLSPDFATSRWVYWSYAEPGTGAETGLAGTAVARGHLDNNRLSNVQVVFRQKPKVKGDGHFGSRLAWAKDGTLFITLGERQQDSPSLPNAKYAQNTATTLGKVVRIAPDGSIPADNPSWPAGAQPGLWSIGHRNPQGAAVHPTTGDLWLVEHGPQGGDELNLVKPGQNYGWPLRSYGCQYGNPFPNRLCRVNGGVHAPQFAEPLTTWVPSVSPSGLVFYTGQRYPGWRGSVFTGALSGRALWRITLKGDQVVSKEALLTSLGERIRDVRQGPDGWLYILTDQDAGSILRVRD